MSLDTLLEAARYIEQQELRHRLEEEPAAPPAPVSALSNGVAAPPPQQLAPALCALPDLLFEHSTPRANSHGPSSMPSPPGGGAGAGAGVRAGTREVHNKLEKNRRAHLKECFELLKRQLPAAGDDKKASNLAILGCANRYIQVLRRKERECEHEMERLARQKIAAQQRLAALKREVSLPVAAARLASESPPAQTQGVEGEPGPGAECLNGHLLGIPISIAEAARGGAGVVCVTSHSLVSAAELRALPLHITTAHQNGGVTCASSGALSALPTLPTLPTTALVHSAHIHAPLSQVVRGGLVVGGALQLVAAPGLRILHAAHINTTGVSGGARDPPRTLQNGVVSSTSATVSSGASVVMNGLTPLVVSQAQLLQAHSLHHKVPTERQYPAAAGALAPAAKVSGAPVLPPHT